MSAIECRACTGHGRVTYYELDEFCLGDTCPACNGTGEEPVAAEPAAPCVDVRGQGGCGGTSIISPGGTGTPAPQPQKPNAITRYTLHETEDEHGTWRDLRADATGDYVLYADHIAAMAEQDKDFSEALLISHMQGALDSERKYREEIKELRAQIAALTHRDADVGRDDLLPLITRAVMEVRADGDDTWRSSHLADILIPAILAKFHVAKKGHA